MSGPTKKPKLKSESMVKIRQIVEVEESLPGPSQPGPSQPGPSQPGPSQPGPSQPGPSRAGPSYYSGASRRPGPQELQLVPFRPMKARITRWIKDYNQWESENRMDALDSFVKALPLNEMKRLRNLLEPAIERRSLPNFPENVLLNIFDNLEFNDLISVTETCTRWRDIVNNSHLWMKCALSTGRLQYFELNQRSSLDPQTWRKLKLYLDIANAHSENILAGQSFNVSLIYLESYIMVTGMHDGSVKVWSANTNNCVLSLHNHDDAITTVDMNQEFIVTGSADTSITVTNLLSKSVTKYVGHENVVSCVKMLDDRLISGSSDGTVYYWSVNYTRPLKLVYKFNEPCQFVSLKDSWMFASNSNGKLFIWNNNCRIVNLEPIAVSCVEVNYANIAVGMVSGHVSFLDWMNNRLVNFCPASSSYVCPVLQLKIRNNLLVSLHKRSLVQCFDVQTGNNVRILADEHVHSSLVELYFRYNCVVMIFFDGIVKSWDLDTDSVKMLMENSEEYNVDDSIQDLGTITFGQICLNIILFFNHENEIKINKRVEPSTLSSFIKKYSGIQVGVMDPEQYGVEYSD